MRAYINDSEEAAHARDLLKDWTGERFLTAAQCQALEQDTVCDLRRTNIFLRAVLFFFTLVTVGAVAALFVVNFGFFRPSGEKSLGIFLLVLGPCCYAAAELVVSVARLYRHGIEEALAACSVGCLCLGLELVMFSGPQKKGAFVVPALGVAASLWIWHRFGFSYAPAAAMTFAASLPGYFTHGPAAQHVMVAALFALGLGAVAILRDRCRWTCFDYEYSVAEALLWLGIYLGINLQMWALLSSWWTVFRGAKPEFPGPFYWATWILTWCLPPIILARGLWWKDRFVLAAGAIAAVLTFATNKPYLGWPRHTWDPMLLGALLIGVALWLRHWLAAGPGEVRRGFTARRLSSNDLSWMNAGRTAFGLVSPSAITPSTQTENEFRFGGGDSGGGGASSDF